MLPWVRIGKVHSQIKVSALKRFQAGQYAGQGNLSKDQLAFPLICSTRKVSHLEWMG